MYIPRAVGPRDVYGLIPTYLTDLFQDVIPKGSLCNDPFFKGPNTG